MSNPYLEKARASNRTKRNAEGVSGSGEDSYSRAKRIAKGYADGGAVLGAAAAPLGSSKDAVRQGLERASKISPREQ